MTLTAFHKRVLFIIVAFLLVFVGTNEAIRHTLGMFAIGWTIADLSHMLFKD